MEKDLETAEATSQHFMNGCLKSENDSILTMQSDFTQSVIQVKVESDQDSSLLDMNDTQEDVKKEILDPDLCFFPTGLIPPVEMEEEPEIPIDRCTSPDKHLKKRTDSSRKRKTNTNNQKAARKRKRTNASNHAKRCSTEQSKTTEQIIAPETNSDVSSEEINCLIMHGNNTQNPKKTGKTSNKRHEGEPFSCETCGKEFQRSDLLTDHMKIHRRKKPYACDQCELKFAKPSYLKIHLRRHAGDRPIQCDQCEKRFFDLYDLKVHQRDHTGERPFICSLCGKGFKRIYILNKHKLTHSKERPFQCSVCGKAYRYGYSYRLHMKDHLN